MNSTFGRFASVAMALASLAVFSPAQTIGCTTGGAGGAVPPTGTGGGGAFPGTLPAVFFSSPLTVSSIPPGATCVTEVKLNGFTHTFANDLQFVLVDPAGVACNLWCRPGGGCDYTGGPYIVTPASGVTFPLCIGTTVVVPGSYEQYNSTWPNGTNGINNTDLSVVAPAVGTWTLRVYDWSANNVGALTNWELCFGTPPPPPIPTAMPTLTNPVNAAIQYGTSVNLQWTAVQYASAYDIDLDGNISSSATTSLLVNPTVGSHTWAVRGTNATGSGPWSTSSTFDFNGAPPTPCTGTELATLFASNNGGNTGGQLFFDVTVTKPGGITVEQIDINSGGVVGTGYTLSVYTVPTTYVGSEANFGAWTLASSGIGGLMGTDIPSVTEMTPFHLAPGSYGMSVVLGATAAHAYTNGTGTNQAYSNADLSISLGAALNVPFSGVPFTPRVFNGALRYDCAAPPTTYCTPSAPGTSNSCVPTISANSNPNVAHSNSSLITVSSIEGAQSGMIFYGTHGAVNVPWCATGSNSFLCVKTPLWRTPVQNSGGTLGGCAGSFSLDWNAYQIANPSAFGNPWAAGDQAHVQGWFRDPPSCKTTFLSEALELTYLP